MQKTEDQPVTVNAGAHFYFDEKMFVRAGMASATATYYLGFGVMLKNIRLHAVAFIHPQLGVTPGVTKAVQFVNGVFISVDPKVDIAVLHRIIQKEYQTLFGNSFTENVLPVNETGI